MIVALIALVVALSGSAYAAIKIGTKNIKDGAVTTVKIKNGAVNASKLAKGAVDANRIAAGAVSSAAIANSAVGAAGLADSSVSSNKLAEESVTTSKIAPGSVFGSKLAPGAANPKAYGEISSTGVLDTTLPFSNLDTATITNPSAGVYCIGGLSFTPAAAMVTSSNRDGQNDTLASVFRSPLSVIDCANGSVRVRTYDISNAALTNRPFWIWIIEDRDT